MQPVAYRVLQFLGEEVGRKGEVQWRSTAGNTLEPELEPHKSQLEPDLATD